MIKTSYNSKKPMSVQNFSLDNHEEEDVSRQAIICEHESRQLAHTNPTPLHSSMFGEVVLIYTEIRWVNDLHGNSLLVLLTHKQQITLAIIKIKYRCVNLVQDSLLAQCHSVTTTNKLGIPSKPNTNIPRTNTFEIIANVVL